MFNRLLTTLIILLAGVASVKAQYFGTTLFVEGFDADEFPAQWTQTSLSEANTAKWEISDVDRPKFSTIDSNSTHSAKFMVKGKDTKITLTSPVIDATGKADLQVGFYGYELSYCFRGNIDFRFRASHDGGNTWTDLFSSLNGSSYTGIPTGNWNLYKYTLPAEFDGKQILLQFYVDASTHPNPQSLAGYIDGVFLSILPDCDIAVSAINYSTNDRRPSAGVYGASEPLTLTLRNEGTHELTGAEMYYTINGGEEVSEQCTFDTPLARGAEMQYTFRQGIDLSAPRAEMTITAGARLEGDGNTANNQITAYAENLVVSVPYIPPFVYDDGGVTVTSTDDWKTFEGNNEFGWDYEDWGDFYWYTETEWNDDPNDAYLVSRPIIMQGGNNYRLQFSVLSEDTGDGLNKMKVYVSTDPDMESDLLEVWSSEDITEDNALNTSTIFTVPADGFYYLGFHSLSEPGAAIMQLRDIALYRNMDKDAALLEVSAPVSASYTYTAAEKVKVKVANYGAQPIEANALKLKVSLEGRELISESVATPIAPNTTIDYETTATLDLSDLGALHEVKVWVELEGDEDSQNNATTYALESDVTNVPYIPDMGTQTRKGRDVKRWQSVDVNNDGYTFTAGSDAQLDAYNFNYGGGMYGFTTVTLPASDDKLLSRHISMQGGKSYKLTFASRVGKEGGSLPLSVNLLKVNDGATEYVKSIASTVVNSVTYNESILTFSVEDTGIYQLEFAVKDDNAIDYRIYLGQFRLAENLTRDLSIEQIVLPTSYVSGIHSYPVGVSIRNNGTQAISSLTLEATSPSIQTKTMTLNDVNLEPDAEYLVYFAEDFSFTGSGTEILSVSLSTEGDEYAPNNKLSRTLTYLEPYTLPFSLAAADAPLQMGAYNLNRDPYRFVSDRTLGVGFMYEAAEGTEVNDYVATPAIALTADTPKQISFSYYVLEGDMTDFDVFAYDAAKDVIVPVISMTGATQNSMSRYIGFFSVPAQGAYNICIRPKGTPKSLFVNASVTVQEAAELPDIRIGNLLSHTPGGAILTDNERVVVEFTSMADQGVQCVPFELVAGDKTYHSIFTKYTARNDGDSYSIAFEGVDLNEPGEYSLICRAVVPHDAGPSDNEATFTIKSLPIVDVAVEELESPMSGKLSAEEPVKVKVANKGKGAVADVGLTCVVATPSQQGTPLTLTGKVAEPIAAGEYVTYTFPQPVNMFEEGVYTFTLTASAPGDINMEDNTLTVSVNSTPKDFDAGVSALIAPVNAAFTSAEAITIAVTNYGETELFNVPVRVEVIYASEQTPHVLTGNVPAIAVGETVDYTLPGTVDMFKCGDYKLKATTLLAKDADSSNDSFETTLRCLTQDVGVTAILSPVTGEDLGLVDVTVEVTNFGEADVENIPMQYQIGSMPQLAVMEGVIKAGEVREFTFPVQYEFTSYRKAIVKASTMLENDANPANDAMEVEVENKTSGIDAISAEAELWPNPAHEYVNINSEAPLRSVCIYDMEGHLQATYDADAATHLRLQINLPAGHYLVQMYTLEGETHTARLIVK